MTDLRKAAEALRLAEILSDGNPMDCLEHSDDAAAELRRLHEVNQILIKELAWLDTWLGDKPMIECSERIRKALIKAKEQA